jgi:hypothetical protein
MSTSACSQRLAIFDAKIHNFTVTLPLAERASWVFNPCWPEVSHANIHE